ncbi:MAG: nucleoside triphosphate pyrophosphohydrolase family protein [Patescibacteria group bacterium]
MNFDEYQKKASKTAVFPKVRESYVYPTLGLVGETGEFVEKIKKIFRDKNGKISKRDKQEMVKELGDVLWYLSQVAKELDISFEEIAQKNIKKLSSRKKRGKLHGEGDNR